MRVPAVVERVCAAGGGSRGLLVSKAAPVAVSTRMLEEEASGPARCDRSSALEYEALVFERKGCPAGTEDTRRRGRRVLHDLVVGDEGCGAGVGSGRQQRLRKLRWMDGSARKHWLAGLQNEEGTRMH
ncbi:hypothetical protein ZWY2020_028941 [Hordeum vulgare]|nr:hypothetical protein ZWY2020_028941 [Hordeum vulgare]